MAEKNDKLRTVCRVFTIFMLKIYFLEDQLPSNWLESVGHIFSFENPSNLHKFCRLSTQQMEEQNFGSLRPIFDEN